MVRLIPTSTPKDRWPENRLKGSMSECIVEQMFSDAGYYVYRFGYESTIQHLKVILKDSKLKDNEVTKRIKTTPDFIAVDPKRGNIFFVEVKYRTSWTKWKQDAQILEDLSRHWPDVILLVVSNEEPHFKISTLKDFKRTNKLYPLEEFEIINIDESIAKKYKDLIKKYFGSTQKRYF